MKVFLMDQLSGEWWTVRRGIPTASDFDKIMTAKDGTLSKSVDKYIASLIADVVNLSPNYFTTKGRPVTPAMQHGTDSEPKARRFLQFDMMLDIREVGFCMTDDFRFGSSPDGLIGLQLSGEPTGEFHGEPYYDATCEGVVELKCPDLDTQIYCLMKGESPTEKPQQNAGHLIVTGAKYVLFMSYAAGAAPFIKRTEPDAYTTKMANALELFWESYQKTLRRLQADRPGKPAAPATLPTAEEIAEAQRATEDYFRDTPAMPHPGGE